MSSPFLGRGSGCLEQGDAVQVASAGAAVALGTAASGSVPVAHPLDLPITTMHQHTPVAVLGQTPRGAQTSEPWGKNIIRKISNLRNQDTFTSGNYYNEQQHFHQLNITETLLHQLTVIETL